jgi:hypothetical protein
MVSLFGPVGFDHGSASLTAVELCTMSDEGLHEGIAASRGNFFYDVYYSNEPHS